MGTEPHAETLVSTASVRDVTICNMSVWVLDFHHIRGLKSIVIQFYFPLRDFNNYFLTED